MCFKNRIRHAVYITQTKCCLRIICYSFKIMILKYNSFRTPIIFRNDGPQLLPVMLNIEICAVKRFLLYSKL